MPVEIEAKIKVDGLESYADVLKTLGGEFIGDISQKDTFFDEPDRRLLKTGCGLRIRRETSGDIDRTILCFKGPVDTSGHFKQRQELELIVDDAGRAEALLKGLGYGMVLQVVKKRCLWRLEGCDVCLDRVEELGCFVEIEGPDESVISSVVGRLGLNVRDHITKSYAHMVADRHG